MIARARLAVLLVVCAIGWGCSARDDCRTLLDTIGPRLVEIRRLEKDPALATASVDALEAMNVAYADLAQALERASLSGERSKRAAGEYQRAARDVATGYEALANAFAVEDEARIRLATRALTAPAGRERHAVEDLLGICEAH